MKHDLSEVVAVERTVIDAESQLIELADLQLVHVGGGNGEVVVA